MAIYQYGQLNTTALTVPGLYVQIVPPQTVLLNGVPSNLGGVVGTATWGPVNAPVIFNGVQDGSQIFGPMNNRLNDMMSHVNAACMQGAAGAYVGVRVSDGTDTAATGAVGNAGSLSFWTALANAINTGQGTPRGPSNIVTAAATATGLIFTAKYTGSLGNTGQVSLTSGGAANSWRLVFSINGAISEIFDNLGAAQSIAVPAVGNILFTVQPTAAQTITLNGTVCTAVASGAVSPQFNIGVTLQGTLSNFLLMANASADAQLVKFKYGIGATTIFLTAATAGVGGNALTTVTNITGATASGATLAGGQAAITAPTAAIAVLSGGTDGVTTITTSTLLGVDTVPRSGMYRLRKMNCAAAILCDLSDSTSFAAQAAFGQAEGVLMGVTTPSGDTIANAVTVKQAAGIDNPWVKYLFGDWISFQDTTNGLTRTISPQGFWLGRRVNLSPQNSTLNKMINGIVSTQRTAANQPYQNSDISQLYQAGLDVITNPSAGAGYYYSCVTGRNSSSAPGTHGENYTTMTDFLAATINQGMGIYIGQLQSLQTNDMTRRNASATLNSFLANLAAPGGDITQAMINSWQVVLNTSNNSPYTIGLGYMFAYVKVIYLSVVEFFIINLEGGQTVTITTANAAPF